MTDYTNCTDCCSGTSVPCCASQTLPDVLHVSLANHTGCACAAGVTFTITRGAFAGAACVWYGTVAVCGRTLKVSFWMDNTATPGNCFHICEQWSDGCGTSVPISTPSGTECTTMVGGCGQSATGVCPPSFSATLTNVDATACCGGAGSTIDITITV